MNLLVIRFSAMGDVALTLPALQSALHYNPRLTITLVTKKPFADLFYGIDRLSVMGVDLFAYQGFYGLFRLFLLLKKGRFDAVADLHDTIRSGLLRLFFTLSGTKTYVYNKGRVERKALTRKANKVLHPLPHVTERYGRLFAKMGLKMGENTFLSSPLVHLSDESVASAKKYLDKYKGKKRIGIAPLAGFQLKQWPAEFMGKYIRLLTELHQAGIEVFLLGGKSDIPELEKLVVNDQVHLVAGVAGGLKNELALISQFDLVLSMDSGNMHLAALLGVPVISIFGTTHPYLGFAPLGQEMNVIQTDLDCRPCSVFGNTTCYRGDFACMASITPETVLGKTEKILGLRNSSI